MEKDEFLKRMTGNIFLETMLPVFELFEPYLIDASVKDLTDLEHLQEEMVQTRIIDHIRALNEALKNNKRNIIKSYIGSLRKNCLDYIRMALGDDLARSFLKKKKVLLSYLNLSRIIMKDGVIQSSLEQPGRENRLIYCVGMMDIEKDDIEVNREIANIANLSAQYNTYCVIPTNGCTFDVFKTFLEKHEVSYIHIAGHASSEKIMFMDSGVKYTTLERFIREIKKHYILVFLNCCETYELIGKQPTALSKNAVCYENTLLAQKAYNTSEVFYNALFGEEDVNEAWKVTTNSVVTEGYHFL